MHFRFQAPSKGVGETESEVFERFEREKMKVFELFERSVKVLSKHNAEKLTLPSLKVRATERKLQSVSKMVEDHVTVSYELVEKQRRKPDAGTQKTPQKAENA